MADQKGWKTKDDASERKDDRTPMEIIEDMGFRELEEAVGFENVIREDSLEEVFKKYQDEEIMSAEAVIIDDGVLAAQIWVPTSLIVDDKDTPGAEDEAPQPGGVKPLMVRYRALCKELSAHWKEVADKAVLTDQKEFKDAERRRDHYEDEIVLIDEVLREHGS